MITEDAMIVVFASTQTIINIRQNYTSDTHKRNLNILALRIHAKHVKDAYKQRSNVDGAMHNIEAVFDASVSVSVGYVASAPSLRPPGSALSIHVTHVIYVVC